MADGLLTALAFAVMYLAFALLALSQERHWAEVAGALALGAPSALTLRIWRRAASVGLAAGWGLCWLRHGPGFGTLLWVLLLAAGAFAVAMTLAWRPAWLKFIAYLHG